MLFVFVGVPTGVLMFWCGGNVLLSYVKSSEVSSAFAVGLGSTPLAILLGSVVAIPLAIVSALVFILAIKTRLGKKNLVATGAFSSVIILLFIFSSSYLYNIVYLGKEIGQANLRISILLWLLFSSGLTGAILGKLLKGKLN